MSSNYEVEARGLALWQTSTSSIDFEGSTYSIDFQELRPENVAKDRIRKIDDHTAELTVEDPNGLV